MWRPLDTDPPRCCGLYWLQSEHGHKLFGFLAADRIWYGFNASAERFRLQDKYTYWAEITIN